MLSPKLTLLLALTVSVIMLVLGVLLLSGQVSIAGSEKNNNTNIIIGALLIVFSAYRVWFAYRRYQRMKQNEEEA